jgi:uncharacterized coiled-coil DUF342 family protein
MTTKERIEKIKSDINELGIISMNFDGFDNNGNLKEIEPSISSLEEAIKTIREHNNKYPPEWESKYIEFVEKVREEVWKHEDQREYFEKAQKYFWWFHKAKYDVNEAYRLTLEKFNPEYYWNN